MTIPFLNLFKKAKARLFEASAPPAVTRVRVQPVTKQMSDRLSKTVMPNVTRVSPPPPDPFQTAAGSGPVKMPSRAPGLPPAVAFALEPKVDRAISLPLCDILEHVPSGYAKSAESFDVNRRILLKASEVEKGMASGKPTISLASIYEQAPDIFMSSLAPEDATLVSLPFDKVLEQFESAQVRSDQMRDQAVPQLDTPILQVTIEDTQRFGTTMEPLQTSALPPVKVEFATAETLASAQPEAIASETAPAPATARRGIPLNPPSATPPSFAEPAASPTRIPFHLPPNGAGAPASERVPASSGPPVPTSPPTAPTPARVPFRISPPCEDLRPKFTLVPGVEPSEDVAATERLTVQEKDTLKITLGLQVVMQNVPAFQLSGSASASSIPEDVRIEFPFSLIEPQLASGRVAIDSKIFQAAIPESYRALFVDDPTETSVLLPLQEVLKNLPAAALRMREDQEEIETVDYFETPFSLKAEEDAQRLPGIGVSAPEATEGPLPPTEEVAAREPDKVESAREPETVESAPAEQTEAPVEAVKGDSQGEGTNEAKEVVARAIALPGVAACSVTFADGLGLAGDLPAELAADGLCAMAPSLLQRIDQYMVDTKLGALTAVTLHCEKSPITFFMHNNICLTVLHADRELASETKQKLAQMTKDLSTFYTQPETAHVDH